MHYTMVASLSMFDFVQSLKTNHRTTLPTSVFYLLHKHSYLESTIPYRLPRTSPPHTLYQALPHRPSSPSFHHHPSTSHLAITAQSSHNSLYPTLHPNYRPSYHTVDKCCDPRANNLSALLDLSKEIGSSLHVVHNKEHLAWTTQ
jgi:hypothetical protein